MHSLQRLEQHWRRLRDDVVLTCVAEEAQKLDVGVQPVIDLVALVRWEQEDARWELDIEPAV